MRSILVATVLVAFVSDAQAGPFRKRAVPVRTAPAPARSVGSATEAVDALEEVNAKRAMRGLRPFILDEGLAAGARACAVFRARHYLSGHTSNDFSFLNGSGASASGTGAASFDWGWVSCCTYDQATFAGAAYSVGADGKRYMHIFVR